MPMPRCVRSSPVYRRTALLAFGLCLVLYVAVFCSGWHRTIRAIHQDIRDIFRSVHAACRDRAMTYWVTCGTLLGVVRDGNVIDSDDDGDMCMPAVDFDRLVALRHVLRDSYGLDLRLGAKRVDARLYLRGVRGSGFVDVFRMRRAGARWLYSHPTAARLWPNEWYDDRQQIQTLVPRWLGDVQVSTPSEPEAFLRRAYGPNWTTPKTYWYYHTIPLCAKMYIPGLLAGIGVLFVTILASRYRQGGVCDDTTWPPPSPRTPGHVCDDDSSE